MHRLITIATFLCLLFMPRAVLLGQGNAKPVKISRPGWSVPYFNFDQDPKLADRLRKQLGEAEYEVMRQTSTPSAWPERLASETSRQSAAGKENIGRMNMWMVSTLNSRYVLLWVPAARNTHLPPGWKSSNNFYMVWDRLGVAMTSDSVKPDSYASLTFKKTGSSTNGSAAFWSVLNRLLQDYPEDFRNAKGKEIDKEVKLVLSSKAYRSKWQLPGFEDGGTILSGDGKKAQFVATKGKYASQDAARKAFDALVQEISNMPANACCGWAEMPEQTRSLVTVHAWVHFDGADRYPDSFERMTLQVHLVKTNTWDSDKMVLADAWMVNLRIHEL
ncbi:MAG: hypothetical protein MUF29_07715 [Chitinophagaceae bacterium]|jgi:hypothetical protein|nr:hypothetical protein [Chitinophagaceae bacterium]